MKATITKNKVDRLQATERDAFIWDTDVQGFGVRCRPSGGKFYVLKTRADGHQRWLTIGRHGSPWTPKTARDEALRLLGLSVSGEDLVGERERMKHGDTVADLGKWFLKKYVAKNCKPSTAREYRRAVELFINPALGKIRVSDVTRGDVKRFHDDLGHIPYQANRALGTLSTMMNLAERDGRRPDGTNPCRHVNKNKEKPRKRYLTTEELDRLGRVLTDPEVRKIESPHFIGAIRLLILTGARLSEIVTLKWDYVDLENGVLRLPDLKDGGEGDLPQRRCRRCAERHAAHAGQPLCDCRGKNRCPLG